MENKTKLLAVLTIAILLPNFCLGQNSSTLGPPETMEQLKSTLWKAVKIFPETMGKVIGETINWFKKVWNNYVYPFLHKIWLTINSVFNKEVERREPVIKEEFRKETQEMKQELPQAGESIWQKLKDFFKFK